MSKKKIVLLLLCVVTIVIASTFGTLAYLSDEDEVVNTFTVGNVEIKLDEAELDGNGNHTGVRTTDGNNYKLVPGTTYTKDPTVTVLAGSEESYVRMLVTLNCARQFDEIYAPNQADLMTIFQEYSTAWEYKSVTRDINANTITYEFWYAETVFADGADKELAPLFESITVPSDFTSEDLEKLTDDSETEEDESFQIKVVAHAIQAAGFENADDAWDAFDEQTADSDS